MTALPEYQRLEATGLWRDGPGGQRREVLVTFGDATLVISDGRSARPLSHWSLPAVIRRNPGERPALFAPGPDAAEDLEIADDAMIAAVGKVSRLIEARRPHPGRLRRGVLVAAMAAIVAALLFWLPGAIVAHTSAVVPPATRAEIGRDLLADVFRISGTACSAPEGRGALEKLGRRVLGADAATLVVLGSGLTGTRHLPGGYILIGRGLVEGGASPESLAGFVLAETARAEATDPLRSLLDWAGVVPAFRLLTSGTLPRDRLIGYAEALMGAPQAVVDPGALAARFGAAGVPATPYARALGPDDADAAALAAADPFATTPPPSVVLTDADWVALQGICGE